MKIIDIQRFINKFKILTEAVTLPNIRQGILGKKGKKEYPVIDSDKEWYEKHKDEVLKTIDKALNDEDKTLKIKLQKFDTDDFFTDDKPRKLKVKELLKAVRRNFISQVERSRKTEDKTIGIEAQYEMMEMGNDVEIYAVYTPMANRHLTHTKLWVQGCYSPTWCIASSTANNMWNHYHLYEAEYPSVFIVAQKTVSGYNKEKYELKCDPHKSVSFKDGEISLEEWVDEWRNPTQTEKTIDETSIFDTFKITPEDLENTIRKLLNSKKSSNFSKKFGKEMLNLYTEKINSGDEDTKMEYLTKACKNGTFINFITKFDKEDREYFLDELIRYNTLTEAEVQEMNIQNNNKALLYLIKMKRCTYKSLEWANRYFDNNMVRRVYHSLPDEILSLEDFDDFNVRRVIFENIKNVKGLTEEFVNYQIKNGNVSNTTLECVQNDTELFSKCIENIINNDGVDNETLYYVESDEDLLKNCVEFLIKNDRVDNETLEYVKNDKIILKKCIENLIKNDRVDNETLKYVKNDEIIFKKCIENLIKNDEIDDDTLEYIKNVKVLLKMYIEFLIKNERVCIDTLEYVKNDKVLFEKCVEFLSKNNRLRSYDLIYVDDREIIEMCLEYLIKNNKISLQFLNDIREQRPDLDDYIKTIL